MTIRDLHASKRHRYGDEILLRNWPTRKKIKKSSSISEKLLLSTHFDLKPSLLGRFLPTPRIAPFLAHQNPVPKSSQSREHLRRDSCFYFSSILFSSPRFLHLNIFALGMDLRRTGIGVVSSTLHILFSHTGSMGRHATGSQKVRRRMGKSRIIRDGR